MADTPIERLVRRKVLEYVETMDGHAITNLHELTVNLVEEALLKVVLQITDGNQSEAAAMLGINRGTLRTRMHHMKLLPGQCAVCGMSSGRHAFDCAAVGGHGG